MSGHPISPIASAAAPPLIHLAPERRVKMLALIGLIFFTTCGGAFGLEPIIGAVGPGLGVVLILVTPLIWSLPMALMVAELAALMPEEGGYYIWVRETLGPFWGVQEAWWSIASTVVLLASFPVLFVTYLTYFIPQLSAAADAPNSLLGPFLRWLAAVLVIAGGTALNLRSARDVGSAAKLGLLGVLGTFVLLILVWWKHTSTPGAAIGIVAADLASHRKGAWLLGLSYIVYNYSSWDAVPVYAGEVDQPQRSYPRAIAIGLVIVVLSYLLPVLAGVSVTTDPAIWSADAGWPVIARMIGGPWLAGLIAVAGMISMGSLFNSVLLYVSRLPFVMACDGWLPEALTNVSSETAVPKLAVVCLSVIAAAFSALSFGGLALIQCLLYTAALALEFVALIILRVRRPEAPRRFRIPGGWLGMAYVCITPMAFAAVVAAFTLRDWRLYPGQLLVVGGVVASGIALYFLRRGTASAR